MHSGKIIWHGKGSATWLLVSAFLGAYAFGEYLYHYSINISGALGHEKWPMMLAVRITIVLLGTLFFLVVRRGWLERRQALIRLGYFSALLAVVRKIRDGVTREREPAKLLQDVCDGLVSGIPCTGAWVQLFGMPGFANTTVWSGQVDAVRPYTIFMPGGRSTHCLDQIPEDNGFLRCDTTSLACAGCPMQMQVNGAVALVAPLVWSGKAVGYIGVYTPVVIAGQKDLCALLASLAEYITAGLHRVTAEEQLWLQNEVLHAIGDSVIVTDLEGKIVFVNPVTCALLKRTSQELIGQYAQILGKPSTQGITQDELIAAVRESGEWRGEVINYASDGSEVIMESRVWLICGESGAPHYMCGVSRDVTLRKHEEAHKTWLAAIVQNSPNICAVKDLDLRVISVNDAFMRSAGKSRLDEVVGKTDREIFGDSELSAQYMADEREAQGLAAGEEVRREERFVMPDGEERLLHTRKFPIFNAAGTVVATANISVDITEVRLREKEIAETAALLKRLSDRIPGFIYQYCQYPDGSASVPWASEGVRDVYGLSPEEVKTNANAIFERTHPDDWPGQAASFEESARNLTVWRHEYRIVMPDGEVRWLAAESMPERLADGSTLWHGHCQDITSRKADEQRIAELSERFQLATKAAQIGIYEFDFAQGRAIVDDTMCRIYGVELAEWNYTFDFWANLVHPGDRASVMETMAFIVEQGDDFSSEFRILRPDGKVRYLKSYGLIQRDASGNSLRIVGTNWDITEQQEADNALRESEQRFRTLLERVPGVAVQGFDAECRIHYWNEASERFYGYRAEEVMGADLVELVVPPEMRDEARAAIRKSAETGAPIDAGETSLLHRDGRILQAFSSSAIVQTPGKPASLYCLDIDLTAHKRLEEQLRQAQKMEAVGQLAGGIAHDFNNMLSAILGNSQLAKEIAGTADADLAEHLDEIERATLRASALTRQLLVFSRSQVISPEIICLNDVIENVLKMIRRTIGEHIELAFVPETKLENVHVDRGQIEQVLINLCVNARDAMQPGGRLTIRTCNFFADEETVGHMPWAKPGNFSGIQVCDTGTGIDEATREHIFDPFFTTKEVGQGTGLGLATVYGIVQQHHGLIKVESEVGKGTTFSVYFPKVEASRLAERQREAFQLPPGGTERILLAEDDDAIRKLTASILEHAGYRVTTARDGREAIALIEDNPGGFDMALLDVVMPQEGGPDVVRHIRQRGYGLCVLFMSGYSGNVLQGNLVEGLDVPMLPKPFGPGKLLEKVRETLDASLKAS